MFPDAQEILNTLEENREWYQSRIPISPSSSFCSNKSDDRDDESSKFQFDIEEEGPSSEQLESNQVVLQISKENHHPPNEHQSLEKK